LGYVWGLKPIGIHGYSVEGKDMICDKFNTEGKIKEYD